MLGSVTWRRRVLQGVGLGGMQQNWLGSPTVAQPGTLPRVQRRHLLVEDPKGQVILREAAVRLDAPVPLLLLAADLADRGGPRELRRAAELIEEWAHPGS